MITVDFYKLLQDNRTLMNMPPVKIQNRVTDKRIVYNKTTARLDWHAGDIYGDERLWRIILWANPEYDMEFDIPDNTVIRIPYPAEEVLPEIEYIINANKDNY